MKRLWRLREGVLKPPHHLNSTSPNRNYQPIRLLARLQPTTQPVPIETQPPHNPASQAPTRLKKLRMVMGIS